jgi:cysteine dioxygenase
MNNNFYLLNKNYYSLNKMLDELINQITYEIEVNKISFNSEKIKNILINYTKNDWEKYITLDINKKVFNKLLIYKNNLFEIFLILWPSNTSSKIHNHSKNGCFLKLLKGDIKEQLYDTKLNFLYSNILNENYVGFLKDDIGYHSITNLGDTLAISLHIYSPPNFITEYF